MSSMKPYASEEDCLQLWGEAKPVTSSPGAVRFLEGRGINADAIARSDTARIYPATSALFNEGAPFEKSAWYHRSRYCLMFPMFDAQGRMRNFRMRAIERKPKVDGQTRALMDYGCAGLIMSNAAGVDAFTEPPIKGPTVHVEGEIDLLSWVSEHGQSWPVYAAFSGAWSDLMGDHFKDITVALRTDPDTPGDDYAAKIGRTMAGCKLLRMAREDREKQRDDNDRLTAGDMPSHPLDGCVPYTPPAIVKKEAPRGGLLKFDEVDPARALAFAQSGLDAECACIRNSKDHNNQIFRSARAVARFLAEHEGPLSEDAVRGDLMGAAASVKHNSGRAKSAIDSGFKAAREDSSTRFSVPDGFKDTRRKHKPRKRPRSLAKNTATPKRPAAVEGDETPQPSSALQTIDAPVQDERPTADEWWEYLQKHWDAVQSEPWPNGYPSETDLAERLIDFYTPSGEHGYGLIYCESKLWTYEPSSGLWREVPDSELSDHMRRWNGATISEDDEGKKKVFRLGLRTLRNAIALVREFCGCSDFFDNPPRGIPCESGFLRVNLRAGTIKSEPLTADHRARWALGCAFKPGSKGKYLAQYLGSVHGSVKAADNSEAEEARAAEALAKTNAMGEIVFAALSGTGPRWNRAIFLYDGGQGGTGKSQFLHILGGVVPENARCSIDPQRLASDQHGAKLAGMALNLVYECDEGELMKEAGLKAIVSGETVTRRAVYQDCITFTPTALHVFAGNILPPAPGATGAFWDRWLPLAFTTRFRGEAGEVKGIGHLVASQEIEAVLAWAVRCGRAMLSRDQPGYTMPASTAEIFAHWKHTADPVRLWRGDHCTEPTGVGVSTWTARKALYDDYREWCVSNGHRGILSSTRFYGRLRQYGVAEGKHGTHRFAMQIKRKEECPF